jgi:hypothetical protein
VGQLLASLPPDQRAERYREFAAQAIIRAQHAANTDERAEHLTMAAGWHTLAVEAERLIATANPGEAVSLRNLRPLISV